MDIIKFVLYLGHKSTPVTVIIREDTPRRQHFHQLNRSVHVYGTRYLSRLTVSDSCLKRQRLRAIVVHFCLVLHNID
jgi:hypothetical protein